MNRKYSIYGLLLLVLTSNVQYVASQERQEALFSFIAHAAIASGTSYLLGKMSAEYEESTLPDAPPHFQQWARKILAENGLKDADTVPLKMGNGWSSVCGSFIRTDSFVAQSLDAILSGKSTDSESIQKVTRALAEKNLLHEKKHYHDGDFGKKCLFQGATIALGSRIITGKDFWRQDSLLIGVGGVLLGQGCASVVNIPYARYQEKEADRYALMSISSLENLEINKAFWQVKANNFETDLLNNKLCSDYNYWFLQKKMISALSKKLSPELNGINTAIAECADNSEQLSAMQSKKRAFMEVVSFVHDKEHPSDLSLAELAQECLNKRKAAERQEV